MDNDARLAVAGEWWQGAARGKNNVVMMTIGTGIGTGVVIDGRLLYGQHFKRVLWVGILCWIIRAVGVMRE